MRSKIGMDEEKRNGYRDRMRRSAVASDESQPCAVERKNRVKGTSLTTAAELDISKVPGTGTDLIRLLRILSL